MCPSDGRVLHFGRAEKGLVEQVKGITYALQDLIGPTDFSLAQEENKHVGEQILAFYQDTLLISTQNIN